MLTDAQDTGDLDFIRPQGNCIVDGAYDGKAVLGSQSATHVAFGNLIGKQCRQIQIRSGAAILMKTLQDLADNHIRMGSLAILGNNCRYR